MKKIFAFVILLSAATNALADNYNSISVQGQLNPATPIYSVTVDILSGGQVVGSGSNVDLIPDSNGIFSTNTLIADPKIFLTGSDFVMRLSTGSNPITVISTFSITAAPFALTIRGDAQNNNQNVFGAYGNVGIGTDTPAYRLVVSSAGSNLMWVSSDGVHATKYYGDGSALSGIVGTGDSLGAHVATMTLNMNGNSIASAGNVSAARYQIGSSTVIAMVGYAIAIGENAGRINSGVDNAFFGESAGYSNTNGNGNIFVGDQAGYVNTYGSYNSFIGAGAGEGNYTGGANTVVGSFAGFGNGNENSVFGAWAGLFNTTGERNTFLGTESGYSNDSGSDNIYLGYKAGYSNITGFRNTLLGFQSGDSLAAGSGNIIIGYNQDASGVAASNELNIGGVIFGDLAAKTVGISTRVPQAAFDIVSSANSQYAQIWRDSNGVVRSSMSAAGVLMATKFIGDGSGITGLSGVGDNLGNHTATQGLNMAGFNIDSAGTVGMSKAHFLGNIDITTAPAGGVYVSSNIYVVGIASATKYYGDASSMTGLPSGDNLGNHTATRALDMAGYQIMSVSSITVTGRGSTGYSLSLSSGIYMPAGLVNAGAFIGSGTALADLDASNLARGTVADSRLSTNVYLLNANQTVSGVKTFTSTVTFAGNEFSVGGSTLVVKGGNVGLGTQSPAAKLEISKSGSLSSLVVKDNGTKVQEINDGGIVDFPKQSRMRAYLSSNFTITNNTLVKVPFASTSYDEQGEFDKVTNYRFTAKKAGYYLITANLYIDTGSWPVRGVVLIKKNGTTWLGQSENRIDTSDPGNFCSPAITDVEYLGANDYIEVYVYSASNTNKTLLSGDYFTWLAIHKLS